MTDTLIDSARLAAIARLRLTEPESRARLDAFAAEAAGLLQLPIGLVSVVLDGAQFFAGQHGLQGWLAQTRGTPAEWAFCAEVVRSGGPLAVPDAHTDARFADNPLVNNDGVRCYAGVPLRTSDGHVIGTLCAIGDAPRALATADLDTLQRAADACIRDLEAR